MSAPATETRDLVGPYRVIRAIGAGGSARIDLARIDRAYGFQRHVVIKRPLEHLRGDPGVAASLQREARIGGKLRHPSLVAVLDAGTHDDYDYLVLEYVHGASLRTLMQTEVGGQVREVPLTVALGIVIDVARGLHEAHELTDHSGAPLGLVHRDVSPNNVLLGLDGAVKLADFGIAKETRVATLSGSMHGTVTYMAPEQCRGHAFDRRADVFSLGVILYELVTQLRLFWADNDVASLHRVLSGQIDRPRKIKPALSTVLEDIVMTAVAQVPDQRFANARQLADALEALAATEGYVIGARQVARSMEEIVGVSHAPWIAAATVPDVARKGEGSLVEVIRALESELESPLPTFGPTDERSHEEGEVPSAPSLRKHVPAPVLPRSRRKLVAALAAVAISTAAIALALSLGGNPSNEVASPATTTPASAPPPAPPAPSPTTLPPPPAPRPPPADPLSPSPSSTSAATPTTAPSQHHHHKTIAKRPSEPRPPQAGKPPVETPQDLGSAARPANVEWKPTMLMPTDSGAGHHP